MEVICQYLPQIQKCLKKIVSNFLLDKIFPMNVRSSFTETSKLAEFL